MVDTEIIIPTFGQEDYTVRCFDSILKHTSNYRLVWLDNESSEESRREVFPSFLKHENRLSIFNDENGGFVGGVNLALKIILEIQKSEAEYVVIMNNDTEATEGWLTRMQYVMEKEPKVYAVGPVSSAQKSLQGWDKLYNSLKINGPDLSNLSTDEREKILWKTFGHEYKEAPMGRACPMVAFFCTVFRTEAFKELGYLDTQYGLGYGDDDDFCRRMYDNGWWVAVALGSYIFHNHRTTFKSMFSEKEIKDIKRKNIAMYDKKFGEKNG
jgi:GT2 family glycosyltransferase